MTEKTITMPEQVYDALKVILDELAEADLWPRLDHFAKGDAREREQGRQLLRAFVLVQEWHYDPAMTPDDIYMSLERSDDDWAERLEIEGTRQPA
jgi:hypothetical protein